MSARIRNYVSSNSSDVEQWKVITLRLHIIRELNIMHGVDARHIRITDVVSNGNRYNICADVLREHFGLTQNDIVFNEYKQRITTLRVNDEAFKEAIKGQEIKPVINITDGSLVSEDDIYYPLTSMVLANLIYVYNHPEEYDFRICSNARTKKSTYGPRPSDSKELCVIDKAIADTADNLSFRNAINNYYLSKAGEISEYVFGKPAPNLNKYVKRFSEDTHMTYEFTGLHNDMLPLGAAGLNSEKVNSLIDVAQVQVDILTKTLEQLKSLRDSIVEAEASSISIEDLYYRRMIDHFRESIPLLINGSSEDVAETARRLLKKDYY